jgi:SAM-dependent methyltransferase
MTTYEEIQRTAFRDEVLRGTYHVDFQHPESSRRLFRSVFEGVFSRLPHRPLHVLEAGCGNGVWLNVLRRWRPNDHLCGFDLTPEMIDVARERFEGAVGVAVGDITKSESYVFGDRSTYDIVYAYGVVSQLPREIQHLGFETLWKHVAPGGVLIVFDHERWSRFGLWMATKKWVTRNTPLQLVPMFYTNAKYPPLRQWASKLDAVETQIQVAEGGPMRVLTAWRR